MTVKRPEDVKKYTIQRPERAKLSAEESLKRMQGFVALRKEQFVAAVLKSKG
jgi:hypothetical protein